MDHIGNPTQAETVAYYDAKIKVIKLELKIVKKALDDLCANAEPVCDSLEMGQDLKSPKTLKLFRAALNNGWEKLNG